MTKINHWLYGKDNRKFQIDEETNCNQCIHLKLCNKLHVPESMESLCKNYHFGTSQYRGCGGCLHRFTRYDKDKIPCFICKFFEEKK
jgi:hypothetical protein